MPHASATRSRPDARPGPADSSPGLVRLTVGQRVVQRHGVRGRRGVILIFTVVLLTLLAIMGTAYLATSRIDRQQVTGRGALPQQAANAPLLKDAGTLDRLHAGVERAVQGELVRDLFNVRHNVNLDSDLFLGTSWTSFRQVVGTPLQPVSWYENYDAPGRADAWLSSLLPRRDVSVAPANVVWPWIGAPLGEPLAPVQSSTYDNTNPNVPYAEAFFTDPRKLTTGGFTNDFNVGTKVDRFATFNPNELSPSSTPATVALNNESLVRRNNVAISSLTLGRSGVTDTTTTVRTYPAIIPGGLATNVLGHRLIAGDADGDGIADGGLIPIALNPQFGTGSLYRYLDTTNNVVYFASYRVVDNSAKINLNTALDNRGDVVEMSISARTANENADSGDHSTAAYQPIGSATPATGGNPPPELREYLTDNPNLNNASPPAGYTTPELGAIGPNYGFFRSNVGLTGLVRQLMSPMNQALDSNEYNRTPSQSDLRQFIDARFPLLRRVPGTAYQQTALSDDKDIANLAASFPKPGVASWYLGSSYNVPAQPPKTYLYRSFGDLLETQLARRPFSPGGYLFQTDEGGPIEYRADAFTSLDLSDTVALAARGASIRNPLLPAGRNESALQFALSINTPNTTFNGETPWAHFPADAVNLWFGWTQDFDVDPTLPSLSGLNFPIRSLDATNAVDRAFTWSGTTGDSGYDANFPSGAQKVTLQRSPRALFTGYNGVTSVTPRRGDRVDYPAASGVGAVTLPTPGLPLGMPAYNSADVRDTVAKGAIAISAAGFDPTPDFHYPSVKVSAATGTKEQLWRAFWSAMTVQVPFTYEDTSTTPSTFYYGSLWDAARPNGSGNPGALPASATWTSYDPNHFYKAFQSSDRWPSNPFTTAQQTSLNFLGSGAYDERLRPTETLSTRQMALLRSAVAACNTIDLRDNDNDITAMDVDITDDDAAATRYYARVYGTEKQLVISGVYIEGDAFAAVEIYNPTDIPIQLSAYRIALLNRTGNHLKGNGTIALADTTYPSIRLSTNAADVVQPRGYVVVQSAAIPPDTTRYTTVADSGTHDAMTPAPERWLRAETGLLRLAQTALPVNEVGLFRTRRADGVPFVDSTATTTGGVRNAIENEVAESGNAPDTIATDVTTLVPVDAVDCRFSRGSNAPMPENPARFLYQRGRPAPGLAGGTDTNPLGDYTSRNGENVGAWRVFYAGKFYPLRPTANAARVSTVNSADFGTGDFAWREIQDTVAGTTVTFAPAGAMDYTLPDNRHLVNAVIAPAIPIQNFTPYDPYTQTNVRAVVTSSPKSYNEVWGSDAYAPANTAAVVPGLRGVFHLLNRFPFGSPIARELDLMSIPYIGSYKIYRSTGANATLAEYVPLPIDATMVADDPTAVAQPSTGPLTNAAQTTTVGRFDPGITAYDNSWAVALTDFVSARQAPYKTTLPDVPSSEVDATIFNTKGVAGAGSTTDQRYAQDGPVIGNSNVNNPFDDVSWTAFRERTNLANFLSGAARSGRKELNDGANAPLVQGLVNLNTAPQIVLRQLPWLVTSRTGQVDFLDNSPAGTQLRLLTNTIDTQREALAKANWDGSQNTTYGSAFAFPSLLSLSHAPAIAPQLRYAFDLGTNTIVDLPTLTGDLSGDPNNERNANAAIRLGILNPVNRPEAVANFQIGLANANRVSNLTSTRSDVYTVYVTVQAWTWTGDANQATQTRLVGERRSSFLVDRSQISQVKNKISDLIVLPIEKE